MDDTPLELMALMFPHVQDSDSNVCVECGEEILPSTRKFRIEAGCIHEKCYKPSNLIPFIPIGCESVEAWRNPSL